MASIRPVALRVRKIVSYSPAVVVRKEGDALSLYLTRPAAKPTRDRHDTWLSVTYRDYDRPPQENDSARYRKRVTGVMNLDVCLKCS